MTFKALRLTLTQRTVHGTLLRKRAPQTLNLDLEGLLLPEAMVVRSAVCSKNCM